MTVLVTESEIIDRAPMLPAFPGVVNDILATLDDDNATLDALVKLVQRDPLITARILSVANAAAMSGRNAREARDMQVAVSMIGLARVREIVLSLSLARFAKENRMSPYFWEHSVAVGVAAQELARRNHFSVDYALVGGLLHDIGQLWLNRFYPLEQQMVRMAMTQGRRMIQDAELEYFGMDHCAIGETLAATWQLPEAVVAAIRHHHDAEPPADKLVAIVHVAEAIANALDVARHAEARVGHLSEEACALIGLDWQEDLGYLFGKIEARTKQLCRSFA